MAYRQNMLMSSPHFADEFSTEFFNNHNVEKERPYLDTHACYRVADAAVSASDAAFAADLMQRHGA
jgi:hypothetical protein